MNIDAKILNKILTNPTMYKNTYAPFSSEISSRFARLFQHSKTIMIYHFRLIKKNYMIISIYAGKAFENSNTHS